MRPIEFQMDGIAGSEMECQASADAWFVEIPERVGLFGNWLKDIGRLHMKFFMWFLIWNGLAGLFAAHVTRDVEPLFYFQHSIVV